MHTSVLPRVWAAVELVGLEVKNRQTYSKAMGGFLDECRVF
jgi:hypothetical protein